MNNLYQQLSQTASPKLQLPNNIKNMINAYKTMKNPQAMMDKILNENPQIKSLIQAANGNPEQAFKTLANQMGVNPDEVMSMLKSSI